MIMCDHRALELQPDDAGILDNRACALLTLGRHDEAIDLRVDIISTRRLKPRLHKRSPPPWTKKNYLQPTEVGFACVDAVSTAVSSGCNFDGIRGDVRFQELLGN